MQNSNPVNPSSKPDHRWFIWTLVIIVVVLGGLASYIYVSNIDQGNASQLFFVVHHSKTSTSAAPMIPSHAPMIPANTSTK